MDMYLPKGTNVTDFANDSLKIEIESLEEELDEVYGIAQDLLDELQELYEIVDETYGNIILTISINALIENYTNKFGL